MEVEAGVHVVRLHLVEVGEPRTWVGVVRVVRVVKAEMGEL